MKKILLLIFLVFSLMSTSFGQSKEETSSIIWGAEGKCSEFNSPAVKESNLQCGVQTLNGNIFYIIYYKGISYALSADVLDDDIIVATIQVNNNSGKDIFVDSDNSVISKYEAKEQFFRNEKASDTSSSLAAKKVAEKFQPRTIVSNTTGISSGGTAARYRTIPGGQGAGTVVIEPASPSPSASRTQTSTTVVRKKGITPKNIIDGALKSKTITHKEKIAGRVYFKSYKKASFRAVFMNVGNLRFVFPIPPTKKN